MLEISVTMPNYESTTNWNMVDSIAATKPNYKLNPILSIDINMVQMIIDQTVHALACSLHAASFANKIALNSTSLSRIFHQNECNLY